MPDPTKKPPLPLPDAPRIDDEVNADAMPRAGRIDPPADELQAAVERAIQPLTEKVDRLTERLERREIDGERRDEPNPPDAPDAPSDAAQNQQPPEAGQSEQAQDRDAPAWARELREGQKELQQTLEEIIEELR